MLLFIRGRVVDLYKNSEIIHLLKLVDYLPLQADKRHTCYIILPVSITLKPRTCIYYLFYISATLVGGIAGGIVGLAVLIAVVVCLICYTG